MTDWFAVTLVGVLAEEAPRNTGPDFGKASPSGLIVVVFLLLSVFLLVFSMNRHLRRLPDTFDPDHPEPDQAADDGTLDADRPHTADPPPARDGTGRGGPAAPG